MPESKTLVLPYEQNGERVKFDFYMIDLALLPQLVRQVNDHLHFTAMKETQEHFRIERHKDAVNKGITPEKRMADTLRLKHSNGDFFTG